MKKTIQKLRSKKNTEPKAPERITNDTVAEHRRRVLDGGKRFKYPVQYSRHKLVINTIVISLAALLIAALLGWWRIYPAQSTSELTYRVTQILPLPVAEVDGERVRYSDYLMHYRGWEHYLQEVEQINTNGDEFTEQLNHYREYSIENAVADTYAANLANEVGVSVETEELDAFMLQQRQAQDGEVSERAYESIVADRFGWSIDEYRSVMAAQLLRQKVSYHVDDSARQLSTEVVNLIEEDTELADIAAETEGVEYVGTQWIGRANQDGGITRAALELDEGEISEAITPAAGDGYYFIRLIDSNDTQVQYEYLYIPLTEFNNQIDQLYEDDLVRYFIDIPLRGEDNATNEEE